MGNVRLGFLKTILGVCLFLSLAPDFAHSKAACQSIFANLETQSATQSQSVGQKLAEKTNLADKKNLKIVNWNLLDFKINIEWLEKGVLPYKKEDLGPNGHRLHSKTMEEILVYQKTLERLDADIYVFQEAIGRSLKYFAKHFLKDEYEVVLEKSKKETELQIAFLVRKNLDVQFEVQSYEHMMWRNNLVSPPIDMPVFHKDLPALYLRQNDGKNVKPSDDPNLIIFGTHFKSMRDSRGDPKSIHQRTVQTQTAARIIQSVNQRYNYRTPIILTGDFNTEITTAKETEPLRFFLKDTMQILNKNLSIQLKYTHIYKQHKAQLDGQMVNEALSQKLVESYVHHFPENKSDHSPVIAVYDMTR